MPIRVRMGGRMVSGTQYRRLRRKAARGRAARRGGYKGKNTPLVRLIKRVMGRAEETKYVANAYDGGGVVALPQPWNPAGNLALTTDYYPAIPRLTQGTDDFERVGNRIQPTNLAVSLRIGFDPKDLSANSLLGVIYYGTDKAGKTWSGNNPLNTAAILDDGDGTNSTWTGNRADLMKPIDKKLVSAKRIVFRLTKTAGIQNHENGLVNGPQGNYSTSNGLTEKSFLLKFKVPKTLIYQDASKAYPQNYAPWYAVGFCHADSSAPNAVDANLVNVNSKCHLYFKDA